MAWHDGLKFRGLKDITKKGLLLSKLLKVYRTKVKPGFQSRDLANMAEISPNRMSAFLNGNWEDIPDIYFDKILAVITLPKEAFIRYAKKTAIPKMGVFATITENTTVVTPKETITNKVQTSTAATNVATQSTKKSWTIESHLEEGLLAVVENSTIKLYANTASIAKKLKKYKYIAPADIVGDKLVPRKSDL